MRTQLTPEDVALRTNGKGIPVGTRVQTRDGHLNSKYNTEAYGTVEKVEENDNGLFCSLVYFVRLDDGTLQESWGNKVSRATS